MIGRLEWLESETQDNESDDGTKWYSLVVAIPFHESLLSEISFQDNRVCAVLLVHTFAFNGKNSFRRLRVGGAL